MASPKKKTAQRGIVAAAATALVVGSSFMPAVAAPEPTVTPSSTPAESTDASGTTSSSASTTAVSSDTAVDTEGLSDAVKRDLGKSVDQYLEESEASESAAKVSDALEKEGIKATTSVEDGRAKVTVEKSDAKEAEEIIASSATSTPVDVAEVGKVTTVEDVYEEVLATVQPTDLARLTAITRDANGNLSILAAGAAKGNENKTPSISASADVAQRITLDEFEEQAKNVDVIEVAKAKIGAAEDIYGAMGYLLDPSGALTGTSTVCSLGFNAWNPAGDDANITAGHCTHDGENQILGIAEQSGPNVLEALGAPLGNFAFGQFGGPGNTGIPLDQLDGLSLEQQNELLQNVTPGTDIAVIDDINPDLSLHAAVSKWTEGMDEREDSINITGVSAATVGAEACSVGRTTGWSCSTITQEGIFFVGGFKNDLRAVWGYTAENPSQSVLDQGDSGGPVIVGGLAVGINSANSDGADKLPNTADDLAFYTSLEDVADKGYIADYQIKFFVNAPAISVTDGTKVEAGSTITGSVEDASSGTEVEVIVGGEIYAEVTVDGSGNFSFTAPDELGEFSFRLQAKNGNNVSEVSDGTVTVITAPTEEPTEEPTEQPTEEPTVEPTDEPTVEPTDEPTVEPTDEPTEEPTEKPTEEPTEESTKESTQEPTVAPEEEETQQSVAPKESPKQKDSLADTGMDNAPLIAIGAGLALAGAAFLLFRRNTRRHG